MNLKLRKEGSVYLRNGTKYIKSPISTKKIKNLQELSKEMQMIMLIKGGVGLAAPQVGRRERMFVVRFKEFDETFINPNIIDMLGEKITGKESCLSIPDKIVDVERFENVRIQYYDKNMKFHVEDYSGIISRIIQHEYDHLEGKIITDYL